MDCASVTYRNNPGSLFPGRQRIRGFGARIALDPGKRFDSAYREDQPKRWIECVLTIRCTGVRASSPSCATARWVSFT